MDDFESSISLTCKLLASGPQRGWSPEGDNSPDWNKELLQHKAKCANRHAAFQAEVRTQKASSQNCWISITLIRSCFSTACNLQSQFHRLCDLEWYIMTTEDGQSHTRTCYFGRYSKGCRAKVKATTLMNVKDWKVGMTKVSVVASLVSVQCCPLCIHHSLVFPEGGCRPYGT